MLFALSLFGYDICQVYLGAQPQGEGEEYVSNTASELDLAYGFAYSAAADEDDEHE